GIVIGSQCTDFVPCTCSCDLIIQRGSYPAHQVVLQVEQAAGFIGEGIGPKVGTAFGVDQLRIHLDDRSCASHTSFQCVAYVQLAADQASIVCLVFVGEGSCRGNPPGSPQPR